MENLALKKLANYLSKRVHSEKELKDKLLKKFSPEMVEEAFKEAMKRGWIESEEEISLRVTTSLNQKNKSHRYISQYLKNKGLVPPEFEKEEEKRKASLIFSKKKRLLKPGDEKKNIYKIKTYLLNQGFNLDIVEEVLREEEDL